MRNRAASILALAAAGALLVAAGLWWVQWDVLDSDRFAHHVREALASEAVRTLVADEIADRVTGPVPVGGAEVEAQVRDRVASVVASDAFGEPFERGVAAVHRAFVDGDMRRPVLDLSAAEPLVRDAVDEVQPGLGDRLPPGLLSSLGVGEEGDFPDVSGIRDAVSNLFGLALVSAAGLATLAVLAATERHRVAVTGGLGLAVGAFAVFGAAAILPGVVASRGDAPLVRDAVRAVTEELVSGLRIEAAVLAVAGVTLVLVGVAGGRSPREARLV